MPTSKLDVAEIARRRKAAEDYAALCRFEGIELSADMRHEVERLVNGEVTPEQCRANIIRERLKIAEKVAQEMRDEKAKD